MYKYDSGQVIYQTFDDEGMLEVLEKGGIRSLHFGSYPRQSSMLINEPNKLCLSYARAMSSWLLFKEQFGHALMIGLGGGSLTKHLLHHFPDCRVLAVESRAAVVKIARSYFGLPLDQRLKVVIDDGANYVRRRTETHEGEFGLIFVDAFDHIGIAEAVCNIAFFDNCKALLKPDGILAVNFWGSNKLLFEQIVAWLGKTFDWQVLFLPVRGKGNVIGFAFNYDSSQHDLKKLRQRAAELEQIYQIEFPDFLREISKNNQLTFKFFLKS
ncbi:MAG: spermine synthase [Methylobacter sp.]|nr:MAG: spermine synthase [Methylobacter sp.]PPD04553.1 MAG: spermine synthase [Methylobacter sp.]PPD18793.1 MAG: spermine synthase [Methylobacter sp.]